MGARLAGKVALITGGGGGIGEATARLFWEEGAKAMVVDIDGEAARAAAARIDPDGDRTAAVAADLASEPAAEDAVRQTVERFGGLDVLANVAAVRVYGPVTEASAESWHYIIGANLLAIAYTCKFAIPEMVARGGGSIINVSSANATVGRSGMAQYDATKSAVIALTRAIACDHADQGIRANALSPGPTLTMFHIRRRAEQTGESLTEAEAALREAGSPNTLLNRQAEPQEVAAALLFLASDESSYITGTNLYVDGGLIGLHD